MEEQTGEKGRVALGKETRKGAAAKTQPGEAAGWGGGGGGGVGKVADAGCLKGAAKHGLWVGGRESLGGRQSQFLA